MHRGVWVLCAALVAALLGACSEGRARCSTDADCAERAYCHDETKVCVQGVRIDGAFALVLERTELALEQGSTAQLEVTVFRADGVEGEVQLRMNSTPPGVEAGTVTIPAGESSRMFDLSADLTAVLQRYELPLEATLGEETKVALVELLVVPPSSLRVMISKPNEVAYTNGALEIEVIVAGGNPDVVELVRNGAPLAQLAGTRRYLWDTTGEPEGQAELTARAFHDGEWTESARRVVVIDRTPPLVSTRVPDSGATDVRVDAAVRVTFSEPVRPSTLTSETVSLVWNGASLPAQLTVDPGAQAFTLRPEAVLQRLTSPVVRLTEGIQDRAGNALVPVVWTFDVPAFLPVGTPLSTASGAGTKGVPRLRVDNAGRVYAAFIEQEMVSVYRWEGSEWIRVARELHAIEEPDTPVSRVDLVLDQDGMPVVTWKESRNAYSWTVFAARLQVDGEWKLLGSQVESGSSAVFRDLSVTVDSSNAPVVATSSFLETVNVWRWAGTSWVDLASQTLARAAPEAFIDSEQVWLEAGEAPGELLLSFRSHLGGLAEPETRILVHRWNGSAWSEVGPSIDLHAARVEVGRHALARMNGHPIVVIQSNDAAFARLQSVRWSGSAWEEVDWQDLKLGAPALANTGSIPVLAALEEVSATRWVVRVYSWSGSAWQSMSPGLATSATSTAPGQPAIASNDDGELVLAWMQPAPNGTHLQVWRLNR